MSHRTDIASDQSSDQVPHDVFMPLFSEGWHTRAVLEGLCFHTKVRSIHIAAPAEPIERLKPVVESWNCAPITFHWEDTFFGVDLLSKAKLFERLNAIPELYQPGWFYQQLLKFGAQEIITSLSDWTLIWDSDLIILGGWPFFINDIPAFALLQDRSAGNADIVASWRGWINDTLGVEAIEDARGTFIPHHMWFYRPAIQELLNRFQGEDRHWTQSVIDSVATHKSFSEYWAVASWMKAHFSKALAYHPYEVAGATTERFFDDGRGLFTQAFSQWHERQIGKKPRRFPSYDSILSFVKHEYGEERIPSSLSLEGSERHIRKNIANRHVEELRSRWLVTEKEAAELGISLGQ
ncbi:MAG: hypothetical protein AAGJ81_08505 [Verrucomicrobiota bacterium]